jgi:hypothetical protein
MSLRQAPPEDPRQELMAGEALVARLVLGMQAALARQAHQFWGLAQREEAEGLAIPLAR